MHSSKADDVLRQGIKGISDLIQVPGLINLDFADVKTIMTEQGEALMGIGVGEGENRAADAAKMAINSPLLETSIDGAKGILLNISGSANLGLFEVNEAAKLFLMQRTLMQILSSVPLSMKAWAIKFKLLL